MSFDIDTTPRLSTESRDTWILSSKLPLITLFDLSEGVYNSGLKDISNANEGKTMMQTPHCTKTEQLWRARRNRGIIDIENSWLSGLPNSCGLRVYLQPMVLCTWWSARSVLYNKFYQKVNIMTPKSYTLFKYNGKHAAKKDLLQYGMKKEDHYIAIQCKHRKTFNCMVPAYHPQSWSTSTIVQQWRHAKEYLGHHLIPNGCLMVEFESHEFVEVIGWLVWDLPSIYWCNNSGWVNYGILHV